ncbi:MAG: hypothetical protein JXN65_04770 [Clostridia bacterium]|nr:hypothetical protein [Clostridia bacterium]
MENNDFIKYEDEIYFFIKISQSFFHVYQKHLEYADEKNSLFTILFGAFGDVIVDKFYNFDKLELKKIFYFIEENINDKYLGEIIATGLVESIVINAEKKKHNNLFLEILDLCGEETYKYIKGWSSVQGIELNKDIGVRI